MRPVILQGMTDAAGAASVESLGVSGIVRSSLLDFSNLAAGAVITLRSEGLTRVLEQSAVGAGETFYAYQAPLKLEITGGGASKAFEARFLVERFAGGGGGGGGGGVGREIPTSDSDTVVDPDWLLMTLEPGDNPGEEDPVPQSIRDVVGSVPGSGGGTSFEFVDAVPDTEDAEAGVIYVRNSDDSHWTLRAAEDVEASEFVAADATGTGSYLGEAAADPSGANGDWYFREAGGSTGQRFRGRASGAWGPLLSSDPTIIEALMGDGFIWMGRNNGSGAVNFSGAGDFADEAAAVTALRAWPVAGNSATEAYDSTNTYVYYDEALDMLRKITSIPASDEVAAVIRLDGGGLAPTTLPDPLTSDHVGTIFNEAGHLLEIVERHRDGTLTVTWTDYGVGTTIGTNVGALWGRAADYYRWRGVFDRGNDISGAADDDVYVNPGGGFFYYNTTSGQATGWLHLRAPDGGSLHNYEWRGIVESQAEAEELLTGDGQIFVWNGLLHVSSDYARADAIADIQAEPYRPSLFYNNPRVYYWGKGQTERWPFNSDNDDDGDNVRLLAWAADGPHETFDGGASFGDFLVPVADISSDFDTSDDDGQTFRPARTSLMVFQPPAGLWDITATVGHDEINDATGGVGIYQAAPSSDDLLISQFFRASSSPRAGLFDAFSLAVEDWDTDGTEQIEVRVEGLDSSHNTRGHILFTKKG